MCLRGAVKSGGLAPNPRVRCGHWQDTALPAAPSCFSALNRRTILRAVPANRTARRLRTPEYGEESETSESKLMYGRDDSRYGNITGDESLLAEEHVPGGADRSEEHTSELQS